MLETEDDSGLIAACGLFCGACKAFKQGKCVGCKETSKAGWCKVRSCNKEHGYDSCADCAEHIDPMTCGKFNNAMARLFGVLFNSNRAACIALIKEKGPEGYAAFMRKSGRPTIPRWGPVV
jgi:hypothetical protein